jgi:hypothetical protein
MATYGVFAVNGQGKLTFTPPSGSFSLVAANDATSRTGTDARLTDMLAAGDRWGAEQLGSSSIRKDLVC